MHLTRDPMPEPRHPPVRQEETVKARYVHNDRLRDAPDGQTSAASTRRLRHLANWLTGILYGWLKPEPLRRSHRLAADHQPRTQGCRATMQGPGTDAWLLLSGPAPA